MASSRDMITLLKEKQSLILLVVLLVSILHCDVTRAADVTSEDEEPPVALLIIDVQNCFLPPSGTLPVTNGNDIIPIINRIRQDYSSNYVTIAVTQDWHCVDHVSFASQHPGYDPFSKINLTYVSNTGELCSVSQTGDVQASSSRAIDCTYDESRSWTTVSQTLWPDHCVKDTTDSQIHADLVTKSSDLIIRKGFNCEMDSYSAFYDNMMYSHTELDEKLTELGVTSVHIVGLATDYCVHYTAKDAYALGYDTTVIVDATRGISEDSTQAALLDMKEKGIKLINSADLKAIFKSSEASAASVKSYLFLVTLSTVAMTTLNNIFRSY